MEIWNKVCRPPEDALKKITGGRLSGMTDISPQWRYKIMTEVFGPCGSGWKYEIVKFWSHEAGDETLAFCQVNLYYRKDGEWSEAVPGIGGSMLTAIEKRGAYHSDECYKMALTDALSVAMKTLGVAADIYSGMWDGSKYKREQVEYASESQRKELLRLVGEFGDATPEGKRLMAYLADNGLTWEKANITIASARRVLEEKRK